LVAATDSSWRKRGGGSGVGIDINAEMLAAAKSGIGKTSPSNFDFFLGGVEILSESPARTFDAVLAANVLAYMNPDECELFYQESRRLLKPGGAPIVSHSNELFDLFTLNAYTVRFFDKYFDVDISSLLKHPDDPDRPPFVTRENPLAYKDKLRGFGLNEIQQEFAIPHRLPPLLDPLFDPDDLKSREVDSALSIEVSTDWRRAFDCSIFGSRSIVLD